MKIDEYARRFGGSRTARVDVVDMDATHPRGSIVADLDAQHLLTSSLPLDAAWAVEGRGNAVAASASVLGLAAGR